MKKYPLGTLLFMEGAIFVVIGYQTHKYHEKEQIMHSLWRLGFGKTGYWGNFYIANAKVLFEQEQ